MKTAPRAWRGVVTVERPDAESADRLERSLAPEAAREVPRSRAVLRRLARTEVAIEIEADDTGAMRAAMNTYLGWIGLALRTEATAEAADRPRAHR